jgi:metal-sulfur cluster biosynthetic enzyme
MRLHAVLFVRISSKHSSAWSSRVHVSTNACAQVFLPDIVVNPVVIALGIKRRVDITKVNRFITDEFAQNIEIAAVIECH